MNTNPNLCSNSKTKLPSPIACINDFRSMQNKVKPLSLVSWANITIHDNIDTWKDPLSPIAFIFSLNIPKTLKIPILIEYICCEKHNFTGDLKSQQNYVLFNFPPRLSYIPNNYFNALPSQHFLDQFFSKSVLLMLYLESFVRKCGINLFLNQILAGRLTHDYLFKNILHETCTFPISHCNELILIKDDQFLHCKRYTFCLISYGCTIRQFHHNNCFYDYSKWTFCSKSHGCAIHKLHRTNYSYDYSKWRPSTTYTPKKPFIFPLKTTFDPFNQT